MVKKLIRQFEKHPNRDYLKEDLNKTEELNQSSEKSKELTSSMGSTEYFEQCEISSKMYCFECSLYWKLALCIALAAKACNSRKDVDS